MLQTINFSEEKLFIYIGIIYRGIFMSNFSYWATQGFMQSMFNRMGFGYGMPFYNDLPYCHSFNSCFYNSNPFYYTMERYSQPSSFFNFNNFNNYYLDTYSSPSFNYNSYNFDLNNYNFNNYSNTNYSNIFSYLNTYSYPQNYSNFSNFLNNSNTNTYYYTSPTFDSFTKTSENIQSNIETYSSLNSNINYNIEETSTFNPIRKPAYSSFFKNSYSTINKKNSNTKTNQLKSNIANTKSYSSTNVNNQYSWNYTDKISTKDSTKYDTLILKYAKEYNVNPNLIKAMIKQESSFNPKAVSRVGAKGLMQLMPATAKEQGAKNPFDAEQNIKAGVKYISKKLKERKGNIALALASYNAGSGNVRNGRIPQNGETPNYVRNVLKYFNEYEKSS